MRSSVNFSQHKCREIAALTRIILDMPENRLILLTKVATIIECDYNGAMKIADLANDIMNPPLKTRAVVCINPACPNDVIPGTEYCELHDLDL